MARVENITLDVGHAQDNRQFAEVSYNIIFGEWEVRFNINCHELVILFERDSGLDTYFERIVRPVAHEIWQSFTVVNGNDWRQDDLIGVVHNDFIEPNGNNRIERQHRKVWQFPNNEIGKEEYRALVRIIPNFHEGAGWSNEVKKNLR